MIFWVARKICIMKNEKRIIFPVSQYVNSNPVCYCLTAAKNHQANRVLPITRQEIVNLTNKEVQNAENIEEITNQN